MNDNKFSNIKKYKIINYICQASILIWGAWWIHFVISEFISYGFNIGLIVVLFIITFMILMGVFLAFRKEVLGGIYIILANLLFALLDYLFGILEISIVEIIVLSIPAFIGGILLIIGKGKFKNARIGTQ